MIQIRPTFSESWYRVATLKARLRAGAQISRQFYRGERWYVVRDPAGNQFHRLSDAAYRFVGLLDGTRTVEEAWDVCGGQLADDAPTQPEIIQILSHLYSANLIEADVTPDATVLLRRHKQLNKRKMQGRLMNVLFPRIPLWDPDRFLVRWMPVMRHVISGIGAIVWLATVIFALALIVPRFQELERGAKAAIDPGNWLWLWGVFVVIKLIHELGHAFGCRRFGGECHELGVMFLVFIPTPYVDASAAWAFTSRWQRIYVGAAGMIFELFVASVLAIVWVNLGNKESLGAVLCYNAMLIASVSTLVFNANPLLRYDGYYILSDFLEIPNLRQKSTEYATGLIKRHVFGVKATQPLPPGGQRVLLFLYATASSIYRVFVGFVIILVVAYKIPILGQLMAIGGVITWLFVPIGKLTKYLALEPELHRKRGRAVLFCTTVAAAAVVTIGFIRFPVYIDGEGIGEAEDHAVVNATYGGFVDRVVARDGQPVRKGDALVVCRDPQVDYQIAAYAAQLRGKRAELLAAGAQEPAQRGIIQADIDVIESQASVARHRRDELTIRAPIDGVVVAPHLADLPDSFLQRGQEVATVANAESLLVWAVVDQTDHELVVDKALDLRAAPPTKNGPVQVAFVGDILDPVPGQATVFVSSTQDKLRHAALTHNGGGTLAPDPSDPKGERALVKQFEICVQVANPTGHYYPGQRAYVRFQLDRQPLIYTWVRRLYQMLQSHENDSQLT